jgi:hypothetical protein
MSRKISDLGYYASQVKKSYILKLSEIVEQLSQYDYDEENESN